MPNPHIKTEFAMPDPSATPLNLVQLFQLANVLVSSEMEGNYNSYVLQKGTPNQADQDKVWIQKDTQGRPVAIRVYWNGSWRRIYNGMLGEIRGYTGNPGTDFDSTGWGKVGLEYDGWHLCNGNDGTPDYSDHFLIGAHMNNADHSGYVGGEWVTWIGDDTGKHTGGVRDFTMNESTTWRPAREGVAIDHWRHDDATRDPVIGKLYGKPDASIDEFLDSDSGNQTPDAVSVIPPFIALGWIVFLGYRT